MGIFSSGRREDLSRGIFLLGVVKRIQGAFFVATCSTGDFRASLRTTKVGLQILQKLGDDRRT